MKRSWSIAIVVSSVLLLSMLGSAVAQNPQPPATPQPKVGGPVVPDSVEGVTESVGNAFVYQGQLKQANAPVNGTCDMTFSLYGAVSGGTQIGNPINRTVSVANGLFTAELDFGATAFIGDARYLNIAVRCPSGSGSYTTLSPRQLLAPTPYALSLRPGATMSGTLAAPMLTVSNNSTTGRGVYGEATATTGATDGGYFRNYSISGRGVYGYASASSGATRGVYGVSSSTDQGFLGGVGVLGYSPSNIGVYGSSDSGTGVHGWTASTTTGKGVYGEATATTGATDGGYFRNYSISGRGVYGYASASSGATRGVYGVSSSTDQGFLGGVGVLGYSPSNIGVYGLSDSGNAIYAQNNASADSTIVAQNTGTGDTYRSMNAAGTNTIFKVTSTGRVWTSAVQIYGGGDLAEKFDVKDAKTIEPGTLLVIDPDRPGELMISTTAYDGKVVGVVSGAQGVNPGLTLHQEGMLDGDTVVAIAGRVYVKADAGYGSIKPGDLLTTSGTPGHAMKASDRDQAYGAVIGKAMTGLERGTGYVLVLVNLQ